MVAVWKLCSFKVLKRTPFEASKDIVLICYTLLVLNNRNSCAKLRSCSLTPILSYEFLCKNCIYTDIGKTTHFRIWIHKNCFLFVSIFYHFSNFLTTFWNTLYNYYYSRKVNHSVYENSVTTTKNCRHVGFKIMKGVAYCDFYENASITKATLTNK